MIIVTFALILITSFLALCIGQGAQIEWGWLLTTAWSPVCLLLFWKKPTLKSSQNIFAIVFALAFAVVHLFAANNLVASRVHLPDKDLSLYYIIFTCGTALCAWLIGSLVKRHYLLFVLGVTFAIAYCCVPQTSATLCAMCFALVAISASCILASAISLNKRINKASLTLQIKNVAHYLLLRNMAFSATVVALFVVLTGKYLNVEAMRVASLTSNIVGAVLLCVLTFTYLRQPLDFVSETKLEYLLAKHSDVDQEAVKQELQDRLATFQNFPFAILMKKICGIVSRSKVVGLDKVTETATCFVANHYEIYGPYITVAKFPKLIRPWTEWAMTDKNAIAKQLRSGIDNVSAKFVVKTVRKKIPQMVAHPLYKIVQIARPIAVYHNGTENFQKMFNESAEALNVGDSIMIFPEKPPVGQNYLIGGVDKLHTGFVEIAIYYKNLTGQNLSFYPLYIDKNGKQMIVGDKISYNYDAPIMDEKTRIADELYQKLDEMYRKCNDTQKQNLK